MSSSPAPSRVMLVTWTTLCFTALPNFSKSFITLMVGSALRNDEAKSLNSAEISNNLSQPFHLNEMVRTDETLSTAFTFVYS